MDEREQRIAIAEACKPDEWVIVKRGLYYRQDACGYTSSIKEAWKLPKAEAKRYEMYADRSDVAQCEKVLIEPAPASDYLHDLNAMHEAEKALDDVGRLNYAECLKNLIRDQETAQSWHEIVFLCLNAPAAQRAEAFLRTIGKWRD